MTIQGINVEQALENAKKAIDQDTSLSASTRAVFEVLIVLITALLGRAQRNSRNSHTPPSADPNRPKSSRSLSNKPRGGQPGHVGTTLEPVEIPDEIQPLSIDRRTLPPGRYTPQGFEKRQVMDIEVLRWVTEYQAEVLVDEHGQRFVAEFPAGVTRPIQYGPNLKAHAVYLSQYQLLPYERIREYLADQLGVPLSAGSLVRFNEQAAEALSALGAPSLIAQHLQASPVLHADETGINIGGKKIWLHSVSSSQWTLYTPHAKRGREAIDEAGVLPDYQGILCHDHWKPYYTLEHCQHSLCNAHHLRELTGALEQAGQAWAQELRELLLEINQAIEQAGGKLSPAKARCYRQRYRDILARGEIECPAPPQPPPGAKTKGRLKRSKSRNLLERLQAFEDDVLRFMTHEQVPFTNNQGERDLRMAKVQQKISGCFRSLGGAQTFCVIRSYVSSCRKQSVNATQALAMLFQGQLPGIFCAGAE